MEIFAFIIEALVGLLDLACCVADLISWIQGKPNRVERRVARRGGEVPPPRDKWNRRVIWLTVGVVLFTGLFVYLRVRG